MSAFPPDESPYHWVAMPMKSETVAFLATNCVFEALSLAVVGLRFYSRITTRSIGWDDWWVLIATVLCICTFITSICFDIIGSGYYLQEVAINLSTFYLLIFILQPLFLFAIMSTKLSVCCFYLRIFVNKGMRIATWITISLVVAWAVAHYLAAVFICTPVAGQYDLRLAAETKCGDQIKFFQSGLSINVLLDAVVIALPIYTVWKLEMRMSDKIGLFVAFSVSIATLIVGIVRAQYVTNVQMTGDVTATLPTNLFLTVFEQQLAIITISIPMLRPLYARYRARATGYSIEEEGKPSGAGSGSGSGGRDHDIITFGGSGKKGSKGSRARRGDRTELETHVELRDVEYKTNINGHQDGDRESITGDWVAEDSGSETMLGAVQQKKKGAIFVKEEWQVSRN